MTAQRVTRQGPRHRRAPGPLRCLFSFAVLGGIFTAAPAAEIAAPSRLGQAVAPAGRTLAASAERVTASDAAEGPNPWTITLVGFAALAFMAIRRHG